MPANFKHDCAECVYLGADGPRGDKEARTKTIQIDTYYHPGWRVGVGFLTRRWGNAKFDKEEKSMAKYYELVDRDDRKEAERWGAVVQLAKKKGIVL